MNRLLLRAFLLFLLAASVSCRPAKAQTTGSVVGRVICADTRTPSCYASVTIDTAPPRKEAAAGTKPPTHSYAAATDLEGAFTMKNVVPGEYYITTIQAGYLSPYDLATNEVHGDSSLKAQAEEIALERISVQAGQTVTANVLLSRGASLSGTVRYEDGGLANTVSVGLLRRDGAGKWQPYTNTVGTGDMARLGFGQKTDDRGRFYAPGLPPGTYALQASLPSSAMLLTNITGDRSVDIKLAMGGALQVFYGNLYRMKDAKPIELREGEERSGLDIDIDIPTSGIYSVSGTVTGGTQGTDSMSGRVELLDPDDKTMLRDTLILDGGVFLFENVRKGSYIVRVEPKSYGQSTPVHYQPFTVSLLVEGDVANLSYRPLKAKP